VTRVLSGAVLVAFAVAVVWFAPGPLFFLVAVVLTLIAAHELVALARATGLRVPRLTSEVAAGLALVAANVSMPFGAPMAALLATLLAAFVALALMTLGTWQGGPDALATVSASLLPSIYVALPLAAMVAVRTRSGPAALFLLMLTIIVSDTAQYYSGRAFGRTPLAPTISPKKTIEGAMGGFVFGSLTLAVAGAWWLPGMPVALRAIVGVAVVALGIAGDLFESMLKRSAGVKDSSSLIPGHGGVLDRIDALLFAAPVYYIFLACA
jgi:phosphatidate cytidylyltransferase